MRGRRSLLAAVLMPALAVGLAVSLAAPEAAPAATPNLFPNPSFSRSLAGWGGWNADLARLQSGPVGRGAAAVFLHRPAASFALVDRSRPPVRAEAGVLYSARAWVRSLHARQLCLRLTEVRQGAVVGFSERCVAADSRWQPADGVRYRALGGGSRLRLSVTELGAQPGDRFGVDGLRLSRATSDGTSSTPLPNLVPQGSFEGSVDGWEGVQAGVAIAAGGVVGEGAGRVTTAAPAQTFAARAVPVPVQAATAGAVYTASAWLRSDTPGRLVCLRLRERAGGAPAGSASTCMRAGAVWRQFPVVTHAAKRQGSQLELDVYQRTAAYEADAFDLDGVELVERRPVPAAEPEPDSGAPACSRYASPSGSDGAPGTLERPWKTAQRLVDGLAAAETGCLLDGLFVGNVTFYRGDVRLTSAPGAHATVGGRIEVKNTANDVAVSDLSVDGSYSTEVTVQVFGDGVSFLRNDVTNRDTRICFVVGSSTYGVAYDFVARSNRVHDCGSSASDLHDHGFYLAVSRRARIVGNWIYDGDPRAGWGVHLYPDADATLVADNVIDGNGGGIVISSEGTRSSDNNVIRDNVISNSLTRYNVEDYVSQVAPQNNLVEHNCIWNGRMGNFDANHQGYVERQNVTADPLYVNRAAKDFRLRPASPCAGMGPQ
jgi:Right handed beta helix region